jgi:integrase
VPSSKLRSTADGGHCDVRGLALFNLAIDSKLRACDLTTLKVGDVTHGSRVILRATVMQQKTHQRVQLEIMEDTRDAVARWIEQARLQPADYLFPSRIRSSLHLSIRQYARIFHKWIDGIGLDPTSYGTHSLRRTKAS